MRRSCTILLLLLPFIHNILSAQVHDSITYSFDIEDITIRYIQPEKLNAPIREEVYNKIKVDSFALRDNVSISLADVLSKVSSVFVKSYGRATISTASFRGASPSHTQVTWNGMKIASPMLGMVDFSMIPSYFVDEVGIYKGANSVELTGGSFGGSIALSTNPNKIKDGFSINYIQGFSSFSTFDQFLKLSYGGDRIKGVSRIYYVSSKNDFKYINYHKKIYNTNDDGDIISSYYPVERNKNGEFNDFHFMQELYYTSKDESQWSGSIWYVSSNRGIPMLNVDYRTDNQSRNKQTEQTIRSVINWSKTIKETDLSAAIGYNHTDLDYIYLGDAGNGNLKELVNSQSEVNTIYAKADISKNVNDVIETNGNISLYQHFVKSIDKADIESDRDKNIIGYNKARFELSGFFSLKYRPTDRLGVVLDVREEIYERNILLPIPALLIDYRVTKNDKYKISIHSSYARNHRYPTLNDMYFMPGGNDSLKTEKGHTFDIGITYDFSSDNISFNGEISLFDSWIKDWILWLPTFKGFWSPVNIMKVNSYGMETTEKVIYNIAPQKRLSVEGNFTITHSVNKSAPLTNFDESQGKQLAYIPVYSSAITGTLSWKSLEIIYKWNFYSKRFTTTSNEYASAYHVLGNYFMNDVSFGKTISTKATDISLKLQINNIFNEEYESVLSRPMAKRSYGLFISLSPKLTKRAQQE